MAQGQDHLGVKGDKEKEGSGAFGRHPCTVQCPPPAPNPKTGRQTPKADRANGNTSRPPNYPPRPVDLGKSLRPKLRTP